MLNSSDNEAAEETAAYVNELYCLAIEGLLDLCLVNVENSARTLTDMRYFDNDVIFSQAMVAIGFESVFFANAVRYSPELWAIAFDNIESAGLVIQNTQGACLLNAFGIV